MTGKIFRSIFAVAMAVLLASLLLIIGILYSYYGDMQKNRLRSELELAAAAAEQSNAEFIKKLDDPEARYTWISADGEVLYDTRTDAGKMENHADRDEIRAAFETGQGESSRYSATLTEQTVYFARRLGDGSVLRISASRYTVFTLVMSMLTPIATIAVGALLLSLVLADRLSKKIVSPLEAMDLESPLDNETYDELAPMLTRLERQRRQIKTQQEELETRKNEFAAVVDSMNEGLVLLNAENSILSLNPAARSFFGIEKEPENGDFLTVERNSEISRCIEEAKRNGSAELMLSRGGREYRISASRVETEGSTTGVVLSVFDITEKFFAERNRREFTANVSHELKTPLQSIMGSAELMENGLVRTEDVPAFTHRIRTEAARLVTLIDDIIRLSQLDERAEMPTEEFELSELIAEELSSLQHAAEERGVSLSMNAEKTNFVGSKRLMQETVHNLCENAVKYNVEGGSVKVSLAESGDSLSLTVEDSGIGIPEEAQDRIFERFYRVDKSRSRQIGGTGLGLSIVKHAVQYMGGAISLKSSPGIGTTVTVSLPKT